MADEIDAVAAYLAKEKAALGDDADIFASGGMPGGDVMDGFGDMASPPATQTSALPAAPAGIEAFPDLMSGGNNDEIRVTGAAADPEREAFESSFPDLSGEIGGAGVGGPALTSIPYGLSPYPAQPYTAPTTSTGYQSVLPTMSTPAPVIPEVDSEPIKQWRARQAEEIKARDEKSKAKREETVLKAEKAIDKFYDEYNGSKEKNIKENKETEAAFLATLSESLSKGTSWERITDLIDLQNSQSKTIRATVPGGSDLARMKEVLLGLRREGEKAPAAGGY